MGFMQDQISIFDFIVLAIYIDKLVTEDVIWQQNELFRLILWSQQFVNVKDDMKLHLTRFLEIITDLYNIFLVDMRLNN